MNTKSLLTRIGVPVLSLGLLGGLGATLATSASASHLRPDGRRFHPRGRRAGHHGRLHRTVLRGRHRPRDDIDPQSVYGPVWAIDDVTDTYQVTPLGNDKYEVDRMVNGTFEAFAQPNTSCLPPRRSARR